MYSVVSNYTYTHTHTHTRAHTHTLFPLVIFKQMFLLNAEIVEEEEEGGGKHNLYPNHIRLINKLI